MYELTGGNYQVHRTVSYPEFPDSQLVFETEVKAVGKTEWSTKIAVSGTYNGPTDIASIRDYQLDWTTDGQSLSEKGSATLMTLTGKSVRSNWTSNYCSSQTSIRTLPRRRRDRERDFFAFQNKWQRDELRLARDRQGFGATIVEQSFDTAKTIEELLRPS